MMPSPRTSARPFVITDYRNEGDAWLTDLPSTCPWHQPSDECELRRHSRRYRTTGPEHPLTIVWCRVHGEFFTLYPPGFGPYDRQPTYASAPEAPSAVEALLGESLIGAVAEAARGELWSWHPTPPPDGAENIAGEAIGGNDPRWRSTQILAVERAGMLVGIASEIDEQTRPRFARALEVSTMVLRDAARKFRADRCLRSMAAAVMEVCRAMAGAGRSMFDRLTAGAFLAGIWGRPHRCDGPGRPVRALFRGLGTAALAAARGTPTDQRMH